MISVLKKGLLPLYLSFLLFSAFFSTVTAQELPLENSIYDHIEGVLIREEHPFFSSFKPVLQQELRKVVNLDSILYPERQGKFCKTLVGRKIFNENLLQIDTGGFYLTIDPVINFSAGKDSAGTWVNTRGIVLSGRINHDFSFGSDIYETQAVFPEYINRWVKTTGIAPGQGPVKEFKDNGYDFTNVSGYISYTPSRFFNFRFGHGKNFIGDGYRSLLLSDAAFNYPFLKITTTAWKFQYTNLYTQFIDMRHPWSNAMGYTRKFGTFHFLALDVTKRLNIGLFEAVIWEAADSSGNRGFDIQYLNPVIYYRPVEYSMGSPDNAMIGLNVKYRVGKSILAYGQLLLDDFKLEHVRKGDGWWANKQAFQLGVSGYNILNINQLNFRTEFNYVRPYTYSHWSTLQCYGHYNQPLAHPYGANFNEFIGAVNYTKGYWYISFLHIHAVYGLDTAGINYGGNVFLSYTTRPNEFNNKVGQGLKTTLIRNDLLIAYVINPRTNLRVEVGISTRNESNDWWDKANTYFWLGLRSSLKNLYYDF